MNGPSDQSPVRAQLMGQLLDEHGPALALYAARWTDAADDCVQEALIELARQPSVPANVVAWLYRVVKHRAMNAARGARRRREREARVAERRLVDDNAKSFDRWDAQAVAEALQQLTEVQHELIVMRIWGGRTFDEIAASLSISRSTAHRIYQQALSRLRERLESPCQTNTKHTSPTTSPSCPPN